MRFRIVNSPTVSAMIAAHASSVNVWFRLKPLPGSFFLPPSFKLESSSNIMVCQINTAFRLPQRVTLA